MNVPDSQTGLIFTCANAGLAIGALGFGLAVDIIGRKWAFNLTCLITSIFGLLLVSTILRSSSTHYLTVA
jgi:MFS family permease